MPLFSEQRPLLQVNRPNRNPVAVQPKPVLTAAPVPSAKPGAAKIPHLLKLVEASRNAISNSINNPNGVNKFNNKFKAFDNSFNSAKSVNSIESANKGKLANSLIDNKNNDIRLKASDVFINKINQDNRETEALVDSIKKNNNNIFREIDNGNVVFTRDNTVPPLQGSEALLNNLPDSDISSDLNHVLEGTGRNVETCHSSNEVNNS